MIMTKRSTRTALLTAALAGVLMSLPQVSFAADKDPAAEAQSKLDKSQFKDVKVTVDNGVATLSGNVDLYEYKVDADKRIHKIKGVNAIRNDIEVAGPNVSDQELKEKLSEKLTYDRVGYGNVFNAISLSVENGAVTLSGHARTDVDKDSALALVSTYPGVKEVNNEIQVDPVSIMDDRTRMQVARAVYSYPSLNKYAIDPAKTIRISVQSGNVELYGMVDNQADKDVAFLRANQVPGVFSVKNYLQVANQQPEKKTQASASNN
jgi:hyperosmotically inducible protein